MLEPRLWIVGDMLVHLAAEIRKPARLELAGHAARTQRRHFFLCPPPSSQKKLARGSENSGTEVYYDLNTEHEQLVKINKKNDINFEVKSEID